MDRMTWEKLIDAAKAVICPRVLSDSVEAGGVGAAILTESGHIYVGVCIDTACSLGMCAERSAIANMITCGESRVTHLVCLGSRGNVMMPCGACRELLMQLGNRDMEILTDAGSFASVTLDCLMPRWWK